VISDKIQDSGAHNFLFKHHFSPCVIVYFGSGAFGGHAMSRCMAGDFLHAVFLHGVYRVICPTGRPNPLSGASERLGVLRFRESMASDNSSPKEKCTDSVNFTKSCQPKFWYNFKIALWLIFCVLSTVMAVLLWVASALGNVYHNYFSLLFLVIITALALMGILLILFDGSTTNLKQQTCQ
jgi:hypothetical protein